MYFLSVCPRQSQPPELTCPSRERRAELNVELLKLWYKLDSTKEKKKNFFTNAFTLCKGGKKLQGKMTCVKMILQK